MDYIGLNCSARRPLPFKNPFFVIKTQFLSRLYLKRKRKQGDNFERFFFARRLMASTFLFIVFVYFYLPLV
jgi:hypothetical protein